MPPAARITDMHTCPVPTHVGGPVAMGETTVLIGYMPAARVTDMVVCATGPDAIAQGENTVLIGHLPSARLGDPTVHGGRLVVGCPTVIIGSVAQVQTLKTDKPFCEECERKKAKRAAAAKDQRGTQAVTTGAAPAATQHAAPAPTQQVAAAKPVVVKKVKPCDFDTVELKCKHCGKPDERELKALNFKLDAQGKIAGDHPRSPNKKRPFLPDRLEVMDADVVSVKLAGGPGYHDGTHPAMTLTRPPAIGAPVVVRGETSHDFTVTYTPGWFQQRLKQATSLGFGGAIKQFFYPPAAVYDLAIETCGVRTSGPAFLSLQHAIHVYPTDTFKIALSLPSRKKVEKTSSKLREGEDRLREKSVTETRGYDATSHMKGEELRTGPGGTSYTGKETAANRTDGVEYTRTLAEKGADLTDTEEYKAGKKVDQAHVATAKSIEISHNNSDITNSFKVAEFIEFIADIRTKVMDVIEFIQAIGKKAPQIGWSFTSTLELFSGTLEYSWSYKEWKDHTVYRYWKIEAALTVVSIKLDLAFGISLLKAKAQVYGVIGGDLKISASKEANPDAVGLMASVSVALSPSGEIGVRGALGDWIEVIGKITGGLEGSTKIDLSPFKWTFKIDLNDGKGVFTARSKLGFSYEQKATIWDKRPIVAERTIIG